MSSIMLGHGADVRDKNFSCIYLITSPVLNHYQFVRYYVGQTKSLRNRIKAYNNIKKITQRKLNFSFEKYGRGSHEISILIRCPESELNFWESNYIRLFDCFDTEHGMNLMVGGDVKQVSAETRAKHSSHHKGKKQSEEHVRKRVESRRNGDGYSEQALLNIAKGNEKQRGKKLPQCVKDKIVQSLKSVVRTEEWKNRISEASKKKWAKEEFKIKILTAIREKKESKSKQYKLF